jgi:hypothetical protein
MDARPEEMARAADSASALAPTGTSPGSFRLSPLEPAMSGSGFEAEKLAGNQ